jgi:hypothetical protein
MTSASVGAIDPSFFSATAKISGAGLVCSTSSALVVVVMNALPSSRPI